MTNNLGMSHDLPLSDEQFAAACREMAIALAGLAITAAGGDREKAKAMLHDPDKGGPLEAIGARPYEHAHGKYRYGEAREA